MAFRVLMVQGKCNTLAYRVKTRMRQVKATAPRSSPATDDLPRICAPIRLEHACAVDNDRAKFWRVAHRAARDIED